MVENKNIDYNKIGFKCGLEIHQQLEGRKLFCNCPTEIRKEGFDFEITRRLRASAGEAGMTDAAALHEQKKQKYFIYKGYFDINCDIELDESPPLPVNADALNAALQICKLLHCEIVDKIQVMRKTVIDGSNTSGFQRTMLVGMNGWIVVNEKRIGIDTVCLEEDACQVIERKNDSDVYNLSRLGIPLIEIATAANIINPQEAKDAAAKLGMLLRSIPNCKRGIGSIRQDVNLSIKGGSRVEIKGFQELKGIPKIIEFEVERHLMIIKKGEQVPNEVRKAEGNLTTSFLRPTPGSDRMYPETDIPEILPDTSLILRIDTIEEKTSMMAKDYGLSQELASQVARAGIDLAKLTAKYTNVEAKLIADTLISYPKEIKSRFGKKVDAMLHADDLFARLERGELPNSAVFEILSDIAHAKKPDFSKYAAISLHELEREVKELVEKNKDATIQALMGLLMQKHRGKVEGKTVMELVKKHKK